MASSDPKVDLIASVELFRGLGRKELEQIAQLVDDVDIPAGQVLMRQGDTGAEMFIIATGSVRIERNGAFIRRRRVRHVDRRDVAAVRGAANGDRYRQ